MHKDLRCEIYPFPNNGQALWNDNLHESHLSVETKHLYSMGS